MPGEKRADFCADFRGVGFKREVSRVVEDNLCVGIIALIGFRPRGQEKRIVLAPDSYSRTTISAGVLLKLWIKRHVGLVVAE